MGDQMSRLARSAWFLPESIKSSIYNLSPDFQWFSDGNLFWYRYTTDYEDLMVLVNSKRNAITKTVSVKDIVESLQRNTSASNEAGKGDTFKLLKMICEDGTMQFEYAGRQYQYSPVSEDIEETPRPRSLSPDLFVSPDGNWSVFRRNYNLWGMLNDRAEEFQLTDDGQINFEYGTSIEGAREFDETGKPKGEWLHPRSPKPDGIWSLDSSRFFTYKVDTREVEPFSLLQFVPKQRIRPKVFGRPWPFPGDQKVPMVYYYIMDISNRVSIPVDSEPVVMRGNPILANQVSWIRNGSYARFVRYTRGSQNLELFLVEAQTGSVRIVFRDSSTSFLDEPLIWNLQNSLEFIVSSERDGWNHLYLYDEKTGTLKSQITKGPWVVHRIHYVDEQARRIFFSAGGKEPGRDPYYSHLYSANLDGTDLVLLTPEDANHSVQFSPNGSTFIDTQSRVDLPPKMISKRLDGTDPLLLLEASVKKLQEKGWDFPERFSTKARDQVTDIYGVMYRPSDFDPTLKYPIIDSVYPGPQMIRTPKSFPDGYHSFAWFIYWQPQYLAELGFIVITLDGLGTPLRSKVFHDSTYGNLGEAGGLEDHIQGIKQLAARYPFIDLARIGIYGHSAGAYATIRGMLQYPDFYKVGVASAGLMDWRRYLAGWGEKYQGLPEGITYENQDNSRLVKNLKGKLLLVWSDTDDNCQLPIGMQLVDTLIKADKDFDMLILPNRRHFFVDDPYFVRRQGDYFAEHLLGDKSFL